MPEHEPLDTAEVGLFLIRMVCGSAQLGHASPKGTVTYVRGEDVSREAQFVCDVVAGKSTEYLCDTYFDGHYNACVISAALLGL
jgi:hypothetical protein